MARYLAGLGLLVLLFGLALATGCGNAIYVTRIMQASDEVARAEQLGAAARAPYEYYFALEHLRKARTEAMEADYGDAIALAQAAYDYASRAVQVAQRVEPSRPAPARDSL